MRATLFISIALFFVLSMDNQLKAQKLGYPEPVPPSAEVSKLSQFSMSPPSLYTGANKLSIPVYAFNFDGEQIDLSFQYHGGGIRTGENSGIVGLGWVLSVPGNISRNIQGYDDLMPGANSQRDLPGYAYDLIAVPEKLNNPTATGFNDPYWQTYLINGVKRDTEPDIFNYSLLGSSGKFILGKKASSGSPITVVMLTKNQDKIVFNSAQQTFTVTTPTGFVGLFELKEFSTTVSGNSPNENWSYDASLVDMMQIIKSGGRAVSAWHLTKIISPRGRELIFSYKVNSSNKFSDYLTIGSTSWSEAKSINSQLISDTEGIKSWSRIINENVYLESIVGLDHDIKIQLNYQTRTDLAKPNSSDVTVNSWLNLIKIDRNNYLGTLLDPLRLTSIVVNNNSGANHLNVLISLYQNYFNSTAADKPLYSRLRLDSLKIAEEVYKFKYFEGVPPKDTRGIDYWGFYNGMTTNQQLTPAITNLPPIGAQLITTIGDNYYYQSANRSANFEFGKMGLLYEVTYPTKGKSIFEYEGHQYKLTGQEIPPPQPTAILSSGLELNGTKEINYVGYNVNGCSTITVTLRARCKNFFNGAPCSIASGDVNKVAAEFVNSSGTVLLSLTYSQLWGAGVSSYESVYSFPTNPYTGTPLSPGNYTLKVYDVKDAEGITKYYGEVLVNYNGSCQGTMNIQRNQAAGGARIKAVTLVDEYNQVVNKRRYEYFNSTMGNTFSSGILMNPLKTFTQIGSANIDVDGSGNIVTYSPGPVHFVHHSGSSLSNGQSAQGSHIGYSYVREIFEGRNNAQNGLKTYTFSNDPNVIYPLNPSSGNNFGASMFSHEATNGALESSASYTTDNNQTGFETNRYNYRQGNYINSLKLFLFAPNAKPLVSFYKIPTGLFVLEKNETVQDHFVQNTVNSYNASNQLVSIKKYDGTTLLEEQQFRYPNEFSTANNVVNVLVNSNLVGAPVEARTYRNGVVTDAMGLSYKVHTDKPVVEKQSIHNRSGNFTPTSNGVDFSGSYELRSRITQYDTYLNPTEIITDSIAKAFVWDYNGVYPIAIASNCNLTELAFTSFETTNKGGWLFAGAPVTTFFKTGRRGYNLSDGAVSKSGFGGSTSNSFKISFWARTTSGTATVNVAGQTESISTTWKLVEKTVTSNSVSISGTNIIVDELRLHPTDAVVETFTYDPMIGVRSKSDPRNSLIYYEYDTRGRLKSIKDEDGAFLEYYEYNYATGI
jgi:hypothetical protein